MAAATAEQAPAPIETPAPTVSLKDQIESTLKAEYSRPGHTLRIAHIVGKTYRVTLIDKKTGRIGNNSRMVQVNANNGILSIVNMDTTRPTPIKELPVAVAEKRHEPLLATRDE